jgi:hypothetical protein
LGVSIPPPPLKSALQGIQTFQQIEREIFSRHFSI